MVPSETTLDRSGFKLAEGIVHVWEGENLCQQGNPESLYRILDSAEQARADRLRVDQHRAQFVACRAWLRLLLSAYTGVVPDQIKLAYDEFGKPRLAQEFDGLVLVFNVSHTSDRVLIAFGTNSMLGVDIECCREIRNLEGMVDRVCSPAEKVIWKRLPEQRKIDVFFSIWVRKEAIIKAQGTGISLGMSKCVLGGVDLDHPVFLPVSCGEASEWSLLDLGCGSQHKASIATNVPVRSLVHRCLPHTPLADLYL